MISTTLSYAFAVVSVLFVLVSFAFFCASLRELYRCCRATDDDSKKQTFSNTCFAALASLGAQHIATGAIWVASWLQE